MQMTGTDCARGIAYPQSGVFCFPSQPIVTAGNSHVKIAKEIADWRPKNPGVLAVRTVKKTEIPIRLHVPARKTKQLIVQVSALKNMESIVEKNVRVGDHDRLTRQPLVGVFKQIAKSEAAFAGDRVNGFAAQQRMDFQRFSPIHRCLNPKMNFLETGILEISPQALHEFSLPLGIVVIVQSDKQCHTGIIFWSTSSFCFRQRERLRRSLVRIHEKQTFGINCRACTGSSRSPLKILEGQNQLAVVAGIGVKRTQHRVFRIPTSQRKPRTGFPRDAHYDAI
jgi:hypothetical protein